LSIDALMPDFLFVLDRSRLKIVARTESLYPVFPRMKHAHHTPRGSRSCEIRSLKRVASSINSIALKPREAISVVGDGGRRSFEFALSAFAGKVR